MPRFGKVREPVGLLSIHADGLERANGSSAPRRAPIERAQGIGSKPSAKMRSVPIVS